MNEKLKHYLRVWGLSDPEQLVEDRATSSIYKVTYESVPAVLKILTPVGMEDEANGETALRCWDGQSAVKLLRYDDQVHLLEYAQGEDLKAMVHGGEDKKATAIIGDILNVLHHACAVQPPEKLTPLRERFRALFEFASGKDESSIYVRAAHVADKLLSTPLNSCVLHGDMHHENVIHSAGRGWLAIDPKGLCGESTYDAANTILNPSGVDSLIESEERIVETADILAGKLSVETVRLLKFAFAHACLSASWSVSDGQNLPHALKMASIIEPLIKPGP